MTMMKKLKKMTVLVSIAVGYRTHLDLKNPMSGRTEAKKHELNIDRSRSRCGRSRSRSRAWVPIVSSS